MAEAFPLRGRIAGTGVSINIYLSRRNRARKLVAGLYASANGLPGSRLTEGSISSTKPHAWNTIKVAPVSIRAGRTYWLVVLGKGGALDVRRRGVAGCARETYYRKRLSSLPLVWRGGTRLYACPVRAYVRGAAGPGRKQGPIVATWVNGVGRHRSGIPAAAPTSSGGSGTSGAPTTPLPPTLAAPTLPPVIIGPPTVSGSPQQGQTLTATNGTWLDDPTSYSYRWLDCDGSGSNCSEISGATSSSYTLTSSDVSHALRVVVTASNAAGSGSAASAATVVVTAPAGGPQIYVAQNAAGAASGADCADAKTVSFFNSSSNWGTGSGKIGLGVTVDLCGTISTPLTVHGSGAPGRPITIDWMPGSTMSSPDWNGGAAVDTNGFGYLTFNGGNNGTSIQATAEGTGLADQGVASTGILAPSCNGCTFENLTIANLYVHSSTSDTSVDQTQDNAIKWSGSNVTVADNTVHDVGWALWDDGNNGDTNNRIYGNNVYNMDHGIIIAPAGTSLGTVFVFDNHVHDMANWDANGGPYHHDGLHCFVGSDTGALYSGLYIYDNRFDGTVGQAAPTAQVFIEGRYGQSGDTPCAAVGSRVYVFNNIFASTDYPTANGYLQTSQPGGGVYNNTVMGASNTDSLGSCFNYSSNVSGTTIAFQNNVLTTCDSLISGKSTGTFTGGSPNYNLYANGGENSFVCNDNWYPFNQFRRWRFCMDADRDSHRAAIAKLNKRGEPELGSPVIDAGVNLTYLCKGPLVPLCTNIAGQRRRRSGPWNAGAY
jgi:hypothetical protein